MGGLVKDGNGQHDIIRVAVFGPRKNAKISMYQHGNQHILKFIPEMSVDSLSVTDLALELEAGKCVHEGDVGVWDNPCKHLDRKSTRLNSSHSAKSRMPSSA